MQQSLVVISASDAQEPHPVGKLLSAGRTGIEAFIGHYNHRRYHENIDDLAPRPTSTSGAT
jgi:hypothetical protein